MSERWASMARRMAAVVREEIELRARLETLKGAREDLESELIDMVRREQITQRVPMIPQADATVILSAAMTRDVRLRMPCPDSCCLPRAHTHWADGSITHHAPRPLP